MSRLTWTTAAWPDDRRRSAMPASCSMRRDTEGPRTVLRLSGVFDRDSASALREELARAPAGELVVDFSHVREFADLGVAVLARDLAAGARRLRLRGLRTHQLRLFRYFGVEVH
jgi:anti-anti-sigma regulatory factor